MHIQKNILLAPYTTFHIGGPADFFVRVTNSDDFIGAISWARGKGIPSFILGQGANILVSDRGFRGLVIKNESNRIEFLKNNVMRAESGAIISDMIEQAATRGLSGLEHFAGIPSSLGGALWQNLHFLSPDRTATVYISDILDTARILRIAEYEFTPIKEETVDKTYFKFGYDYSILHDTRDVVLSATVQLQEKATAEIRHTIDENISWRKAKHPTDATKKSAGSVFKKIEGHGAGRLIEKAGLKGKRMGGAQISEQHANFIINTGNATAKNVRDLISLVQTEVQNVTGLSLEPEISFIGEF
ncbi:MAG TPA: UDP-N-acetylmuramate dehydrogenase [Candidatus Saccharimonadales bacterium]|nr:UDP-N-acetylmuramate dehydrogenase [Candidatus Saccharimonadales bacterium]